MKDPLERKPSKPICVVMVFHCFPLLCSLFQRSAGQPDGCTHVVTPPSGKLVLNVSAPMTKRSTKPDRSCKDQHDKKVGGHARLRQMVTAYTGSAHACRHSRSHRARRTTDQTFGCSRAPTAPAMGHAQQWMPKPSHPCYARRTQPYQRTT